MDYQQQSIISTFSLCLGMDHYIFDWESDWAITKKKIPARDEATKKTIAQASHAKDTSVANREKYSCTT